ncbi:MAG: DEAD/DEAH box helicase [Chrysiogenales bacterium]|nr:MAG: DEAD/DEAH box helicase [Chrysiogenales bacterium]
MFMIDQDSTSLPVYSHLDEISELLAHRGMLILNAETGAGKTTLVPWRLLRHPSFMDHKIFLLEPRRIAARAAADRIATLLNEKIGHTVGLRTRSETIIGPFSRLEVVTYGVFTRMIQNDQELRGFGTLIFDEFHERAIQADIALALAMDSRDTIRPDIKILFMSASVDSDALHEFNGEIPCLSISGRTYPVRIVHHPPLKNEKPWEGAARLVNLAHETMLVDDDQDILVFLPGFMEIRRTGETIARSYPSFDKNMVFFHGSLPLNEQRLVLNPPPGMRNRIILSTNVAETSITIPGVRVVVDTGLERCVRYRPRTGMNHWETAGISRASAKQRTGRAGRMGPGTCLRWWREEDAREEFSSPAILQEDMAPLLLETSLWGALSPFDLKWLTPPPEAAIRKASELLKSYPSQMMKVALRNRALLQQFWEFIRVLVVC